MDSSALVARLRRNAQNWREANPQDGTVPVLLDGAADHIERMQKALAAADAMRKNQQEWCDNDDFMPDRTAEILAAYDAARAEVDRG